MQPNGLRRVDLLRPVFRGGGDLTLRTRSVRPGARYGCRALGIRVWSICSG